MPSDHAPPEPRTVQLQHCLDRLRGGDESARRELLDQACQRLGQLTHVMLRDYRRLRRWEETDDVLQGALVRLFRALGQVTPATPLDFYRLATAQIRRELIDLARHYFGPEGPAAHHATDAGDSLAPTPERSDVSLEPARLAVWGEFHCQVAQLPAEEREVFDLLWYQGLTPGAAGDLLGVSARTVKRRWQAACLRLHQALGGELPTA